jgi:CRP/FNR family nitrogen fixation transcriptional regulator
MTAAARLAQPIQPVPFDAAALLEPEGGRAAAQPPGAAIRYARNEEIFGEGDPADFVYVIRSGTVRLCRLLSDGRRQIGAFCFAGDSFGLELGDEHRLAAEAVTDCEIVAMPRQTVFRRAERNPGYARQLWGQAATDLAEARDHMLLLGRQTAMERIASFLLSMAARNHDGEIIALPMTRQDIADYLGLTIETVSRTLSRLEAHGVLELTTARNIALKNTALLRRLDS